MTVFGLPPLELAVFLLTGVAIALLIVREVVLWRETLAAPERLRGRTVVVPAAARGPEREPAGRPCWSWQADDMDFEPCWPHEELRLMHRPAALTVAGQAGARAAVGVVLPFTPTASGAGTRTAGGGGATPAVKPQAPRTITTTERRGSL